MTLPFIVSPYLRPTRVGTSLNVDDPVRGRREEVTTAETELLSALWDRERASENLEAVLSVRGEDYVASQLTALGDKGMLFPSDADCENALRHSLESSLPEVPFVDQVELTNLCPMRCGFCPRGIPGGMQRPTGMMSAGLFEKLLSELPQAQARYRPLELHHLGESLLHPELPRFIALACSAGLRTELSANPSLLTPVLARSMLEAGLSRLVLSLDGMDDGTLLSIRGPAAKYSKAEQNILALFELADRMSEPPRIVIQMIALHKNRTQREAFLARWGSTGRSYVRAYIKPLDGRDPDLAEDNREPLRYLCTYPFRSVVVLWDGRVVPCCRDDDARYVLGDLNHQTLREIWHGPRAHALRAAYFSQRFEAGHLCASCPWGKAAFKASTEERRPERAPEKPLAW